MNSVIWSIDLMGVIYFIGNDIGSIDPSIRRDIIMRLEAIQKICWKPYFINETRDHVRWARKSINFHRDSFSGERLMISIGMIFFKRIMKKGWCWSLFRSSIAPKANSHSHLDNIHRKSLSKSNAFEFTERFDSICWMNRYFEVESGSIQDRFVNDDWVSWIRRETRGTLYWFQGMVISFVVPIRRSQLDHRGGRSRQSEQMFQSSSKMEPGNNFKPGNIILMGWVTSSVQIMLRARPKQEHDSP